MRKSNLIPFWCAFVPILSVSITFAADPAARDRVKIDQEKLERASELVGQSVQAEMDGDFSGREQLLSAALQVSENFAPAHWYRGQVLDSDRSWLSVDEVVTKYKSNLRLAEYEEMRSQQPANLLGNWQAAKWCTTSNLPLQCRAHLENILMLDHDNLAARELLGHQLVGNDWLTIDDQLRLAAKAVFAKTGYAKYQKKIKELFGIAKHARGKARGSAIDQLKAIDDPVAIPVMESMVGLFDKDLSIVAVNWLGSIDHPQTAPSLARIALFVDDPEVRKAAVECLKNKSLFDFVPELLSAMSSPIVFQSVPVILPDGSLAGFRQAYAKEGMECFQILNANINLKQVVIEVDLLTGPSSGGASPNPIANHGSGSHEHQSVFLSRDTTQPYGQRNAYETKVDVPGVSDQLALEMAAINADRIDEALRRQKKAEQAVNNEIASRKARAEMENRVIWERNRRIGALISDVTNQEFITLPNDLWKWWDKYNDTNYQRYKFQRYKSEERDMLMPIPLAVSVGVSGDTSSPGYIITRQSCFVAGTEVNTLRGLVAIEYIMPGDLVLSRDVFSGELSYKPVICGTRRDPAKTVILKVNDEKIHSTTSHLLWVSGKGWTKAGDIRVGQLLHSAAEPAVVMSTTPGDILPTYNLVVAGTHTYFVGASRVLSHDVLPRGSTHERVPGQFAHKH